MRTTSALNEIGQNPFDAEFGDQFGPGHEDIGITDEELDQQCNELFGIETPVDFKPRKNNQLDSAIAAVIKNMNVSIPIVHIKESNFLVGSQKVNILMKRDILLV
jgi:hypothetical protein